MKRFPDLPTVYGFFNRNYDGKVNFFTDIKLIRAGRI